MLEWRIYYGDGTTFDNMDGEPEDAPPFDVQALTEKDDYKHNKPGIYTHHNCDFYVYDAKYERWLGVDKVGLLDFLIRLGIVKFGRVVPLAAYKEALKHALNDPDFKR